ncbi:hypothetical protein FA13DRAFT_173620 [Coprinellus micaceus]|uniref:Uncharacterized protein n=1 Tax=Coprinellus micaceus TaxID=71717 RepID=A0A4Y7SGH2_COPMI|nr:hypothetical protein FA13DRAFT_173620 [Coprinellus micaceus]
MRRHGLSTVCCPDSVCGPARSTLGAWRISRVKRRKTRRNCIHRGRSMNSLILDIAQGTRQEKASPKRHRSDLEPGGYAMGAGEQGKGQKRSDRSEERGRTRGWDGGERVLDMKAGIAFGTRYGVQYAAACRVKEDSGGESEGRPGIEGEVKEGETGERETGRQAPGL